MVYHRLFFLSLLLMCGNAFAFDHEYKSYSSVLDSYVRNGSVDYASLQKNRTAIDQFVKEIGAVNGDEYKSWSREEQLAFWINAYNGWFLQIVIDNYPIRGKRLIGMLYPENSVQRIMGIWDNIKMKAAGREVSLNDIEHKIIRATFQEPRIHFSIVCASVGCPSLRSEPFRPKALEDQLDQAARDFINNPAKVQWDEAQKKLGISKIFDWFSEDFSSFSDELWRKTYSKKQAGSVAFVSRYLPDNLKQMLKTSRVNVVYLDYDWTLNDKVK